MINIRADSGLRSVVGTCSDCEQVVFLAAKLGVGGELHGVNCGCSACTRNREECLRAFHPACPRIPHEGTLRVVEQTTSCGRPEAPAVRFQGTVEELRSQYPRHRDWRMDLLAGFINDDLSIVRWVERFSAETGTWKRYSDPRR